eukprot:1649041-Amphidinium_carterae.1
MEGCLTTYACDCKTLEASLRMRNQSRRSQLRSQKQHQPVFSGRNSRSRARMVINANCFVQEWSEAL